MSLVCKMDKCKAKPGMCACEKVMSAIVVVAAVAALVKHFV